MGYGVACKLVRISLVKKRTHDCNFYTLNEVWHVPVMIKSLISFSVLDSKGCDFWVKGGIIYVYKGSKVLLRSIKRGTLYLLSSSTIIGYVVVVSSVIHKKDMTKLWYIRLDHISEKECKFYQRGIFYVGTRCRILNSISIFYLGSFIAATFQEVFLVQKRHLIIFIRIVEDL